MEKVFAINDSNITDIVSDKIKKNILNLYGTNPITSAILYQISNITDKDKDIFDKVSRIESILNKKYKKDYKFTDIAIAFMFIYNSCKVIYNLPHMLDKCYDSTKPSIHVVFGESVTQLVSIVLLSEAIKLISTLSQSMGINSYYLTYRNLEVLFTNAPILDIDLISIPDDDIKPHLQELFEQNVNKIDNRILEIISNFYPNPETHL